MGNAAGTAIDSAITQGVDKGVENISLGKVAVDAAVGVAFGKTVGDIKVDKVTKGRGSMEHVAKTTQGRLQGGNASLKNVSAKTGAKAVTAGVVGGGAKAATSAIIGGAEIGGKNVTETAGGIINDAVKDSACTVMGVHPIRC